MKEITDFFGSISKNNNFNNDLDLLYFIAVTEWHWSEEDLMNAEIPFVFMLMEQRLISLKRQEREYKKANRK